MARTHQVGGLPVVTLSTDGGDGVVEADFAPGRGMMLLGARGRIGGGSLVELVEAPALEAVQAYLDSSPDDFAGNASFSFGGAILLPFANRIRGAALSNRRTIRAPLSSGEVELPRNWGGRAPGAAQYAMHGLLLEHPIRSVDQTAPDRVEARLAGWDFSGRWPSRVDLELSWRLISGGLELQVRATNVGAEALPCGIGWHPYFRILSGRRDQVRLHVPAASRTLVTNYDEVLPTGRVQSVAGTAYDFTAPEGRDLDDLYLDDCLTDLQRGANDLLTLRIIDAAGRCEVRLTSTTPQIRAVQVYAPPDRAVVVVEPQFNLADPFWPGWPQDVDTGMVILQPGQAVDYEVRTEFLPYGEASSVRPPER